MGASAKTPRYLALPRFRSWACRGGSFLLFLLLATFAAGSGVAGAQVFTVERQHVPTQFRDLTIVAPTSVPLSNSRITMYSGMELIRYFQSKQGYDVRPLPLGHHGLTLRANGPMSPEGQKYVDVLEKNGISAKPGDMLIITKFLVKPKDKKIIFEFNGGPQKRHFLSHIEVGGGIGMVPLANDNNQIAQGSELVLTFDKFIPEMTPAQLQALIAPILNFSKITPLQAYANTLPPKLKEAVLHHKVLVGMDKEMVLHSWGAPFEKDRELKDNQPLEIWIYGQPPQTVRFVGFRGDRAVRLEIAQVGKPMIVRTGDETGGYFAGRFVHHVWLGDAPPPGTTAAQGPRPAPTLRKPGEGLPDAVDQQHQLKPVQFPKDDKNQKKPEPPPIPPPPGQSTQDALPNAAPSGPPQPR